MKKIIPVALLLFTLFACNNNTPKNTPEKKHNNFTADPFLAIHVRKNLIQTRSNTAENETKQKRLTPKEVVKQAEMFHFGEYLSENSLGGYVERELRKEGGRIGIADFQKDTVNNIITLWKHYIVDELFDEMGEKTGEYFLHHGFITAKDVVITGKFYRDKNASYERYICDTLAYIPNSVLQAAYPPIKEAFDKGDYNTAFKLFQEAYQAIPITGEEWRELKAKGLQ